MPWEGVTVSEQRQRFLEDYRLNYYSITDLAERFSICRKTAHKWIDLFEKEGQEGLHEHSRRPHSSRWQTDPARSSRSWLRSAGRTRAGDLTSSLT
jgi:transposase-like protein